jgi:hypothetical protein
LADALEFFYEDAPVDDEVVDKIEESIILARKIIAAREAE